MAKKVLVVEDNELNLKLFCDLLRAHGYAAEPVRDGREAVARARDFAPDLIIMDIQMPHVTGYELIVELKGDADLKAIPIMAVTAYAGREDAMQFAEELAERKGLDARWVKRVLGRAEKLPVVMGKGEGRLALRMMKAAQEEGIPIMRDIPLARGLFAEAVIDHQIPVSFIKPVAETLKWARRFKRGQAF